MANAWGGPTTDRPGRFQSGVVEPAELPTRLPPETDREDHFHAFHLVCDQAIEFILCPVLREERTGKDHDSEPRVGQPTVNGATQAVTYLQFEGVIPNVELSILECLCEGSTKSFLSSLACEMNRS